MLQIGFKINTVFTICNFFSTFAHGKKIGSIFLQLNKYNDYFCLKNVFSKLLYSGLKVRYRFKVDSVARVVRLI